MGCLVNSVDMLINECTQAGVIFHPRAGQLRPELTRGRPSEDLLCRVKANREAILLRLADMMDFKDEEDKQNETDSK